MVPDPVVGGDGPVQGIERGYWSAAWYQLRHDRLAMVGLFFVILLIAAAIFAPLISPYPPNLQLASGLTASGNPRPPSAQFLLGTDPLGRDELSRLLFGARISLVVGLGFAFIGGVLGLAIGGVAALFGGLLDKILMRLADVILSFPILLLATALLAVTQAGVATISIIVGIGFGAYLARVVYSQAVTLRERDFVLAAADVGGQPGPDPDPPHRPACDAEHHRLRNARRRDRDPARGGAQLCRPRHPSADRVVGEHDRRRAELHDHCPVARAVPGVGDHVRDARFLDRRATGSGTRSIRRWSGPCN